MPGHHQGLDPDQACKRRPETGKHHSEYAAIAPLGTLLQDAQASADDTRQRVVSLDSVPLDMRAQLMRIQ